MLQTTVQAATSEIITDLLMTQCGDIQEDDNIENNNETLVESAEVSHSDNKKCTLRRSVQKVRSRYRNPGSSRANMSATILYSQSMLSRQ